MDNEGVHVVILSTRERDAVVASLAASLDQMEESGFAETAIYATLSTALGKFVPTMYEE